MERSLVNLWIKRFNSMHQGQSHILKDNTTLHLQTVVWNSDTEISQVSACNKTTLLVVLLRARFWRHLLTAQWTTLRTATHLWQFTRNSKRGTTSAAVFYLEKPSLGDIWAVHRVKIRCKFWLRGPLRLAHSLRWASSQCQIPVKFLRTASFWSIPISVCLSVSVSISISICHRGLINTRTSIPFPLTWKTPSFDIFMKASEIQIHVSTSPFAFGAAQRLQ